MKTKYRKGRPRGIVINKLERMFDVLKKYPDGIWLRKLAILTKIHTSTVSRYIDLYDVYFEVNEIRSPAGKNIIKVVRLKEGASSKAAKILRRTMNSVER